MQKVCRDEMSCFKKAVNLCSLSSHISAGALFPPSVAEVEVI